ncbi:MAG TPA: FimV/HubP family polar landmark protein, partial [Xanthomonadales bacterium]|nr:FimV/HubP family polar landmark protein [Xanthomonadales bacterium]
DGGEYGPVQSGETLWRIASNWSQGSGADVNKVMLAIQRNNPQAFINGNINLLKRGAILRMPQRAEIGEIPAALAREEVIKQEQEFRQSAGTSVGPTAVETPLIDEQSDPLEASDRSGQEISEGQLELVPPSEEVDIDSAYGFEESLEEADAATAVQLLREELSRTEEELIVEQEQNQYLQERLTELEEQLATSTEGSVEDAELAQLEDTLKDDRLAGGSFESSQAQGEEANDTQAPAKVVTSDPPDDGKAWYSGFWFWLIVILVVVGGAGWFLKRRNADNVIVSDVGSDDDGTVREIKDEAEKILEALGSDADSDSEELEDEGDDESGDEPDETSEPEDQGETKPGKQSRESARREHSEDAEILDEDSADPEVRLDLARAYIAMGDREAARVILAEVIEHGDQKQQDEAKAMLGEL